MRWSGSFLRSGVVVRDAAPGAVLQGSFARLQQDRCHLIAAVRPQAAREQR